MLSLLEKIKIDQKDKLILQALDSDVRASYRSIGKKVRLAEETVQYRIKRLIRVGVITGFWALPRIGNSVSVYKVLLKSRSLSAQKRIEFELYLSKLRSGSWAAQTDGSWNYILTLMGVDWKVAQSIQELQKTFSIFFSDIQIIRCVAAVSLSERYLSQNVKLDVMKDSFFESPPITDELDKKIINLLSKDARSTSTQIGTQICLTAEATATRIRKLIAHGSFTTMKVRINHNLLGLNYYHIFFSFADGQTIEAAKSYFSQEKSCVFIMEHIGKYQLHIEVVVDSESLSELVERFVNTYPSALQSYEVCPIIRELHLKPSIS